MLKKLNLRPNQEAREIGQILLPRTLNLELELEQNIDGLKKELESKKNHKFQEKCILIAQVLLGKKLIVKYQQSFMRRLELDAFFQKYQITLKVRGTQHRFHRTSDVKKFVN